MERSIALHLTTFSARNIIHIDRDNAKMAGVQPARKKRGLKTNGSGRSLLMRLKTESWSHVSQIRPIIPLIKGAFDTATAKKLRNFISARLPQPFE
jgi:hypothetical protein